MFVLSIVGHLLGNCLFLESWQGKYVWSIGELIRVFTARGLEWSYMGISGNAVVIKYTWCLDYMVYMIFEDVGGARSYRSLLHTKETLKDVKIMIVSYIFWSPMAKWKMKENDSKGGDWIVAVMIFCTWNDI